MYVQISDSYMLQLMRMRSIKVKKMHPCCVVNDYVSLSKITAQSLLLTVYGRG